MQISQSVHTQIFGTYKGPVAKQSNLLKKKKRNDSIRTSDTLIPYPCLKKKNSEQNIFLNNEVIFQLNFGIHNSEEHLLS